MTQERLISGARVAILLCTMNGRSFLGEQLDSIASQTMTNWQLWASDDGSQDGTLAILEQYRSTWGTERFFFQAGPGRGFAANFLSLTCRADLTADYYAFADQDDVWEKEKLQRAVEWLETVPQTEPALYCSRTRLIDKAGLETGLSPLFARPPSFPNALVQSLSGGNTMVFNHAARLLLQKAGADIEVVTHDWWLYLLVSGCGGRVFYDPSPMVRYRQHDMNQVGANTGWLARLLRLRLLVNGRFKEWHAINLQALHEVEPMLTPENRAILKGWAKSRQQSLLPRLLGLRRSGIYRQTVAGNLGLLAAVLCRRM